MPENHPPRAGLGRFLAELKRRHVVRATVAYAAVVFVLLQAAEIVLPAFLSPPEADSSLRVLVVAFAALFPVVLALAWVYEITPQGIRAMAELDAEMGHLEAGRLLPRVALLLVIAIAAGGAGLWWYRTDADTVADFERRRGGGESAFVAASTTDASGPIRSLAVLPLENFSPDANGTQDYFSQGMHEALISQLGQLTTVRVISRTSAAQYDRLGKSLPQIGNELGVDAVVEGSVLRADGKVRITVQLVHAASDTHLWARDYERDFADVIALQREVAAAIAAEIETRLAQRVTPASGSEPAPAGASDAGAEPLERAAASSDATAPGASGVATTPAGVGIPAAGTPAAPSVPEGVATEVQDAFLRGRFAFDLDAPEATGDAARHFERALRLDSAFAPALVGLASARLVQGLSGEDESLGELMEARRLAMRARERDPASAEAGEVLAAVEQALAQHVERVTEDAVGRTPRVRVLTTVGDSMVFVMGDDSVHVPHHPMVSTSTELGSLMQVALARNDAEEEASDAWLRGIHRLEAAGRATTAREQASRAADRFPENEPLAAELERLQALTGDVAGAAATRARRQERFDTGGGLDARGLVDRVERDGARAYWEWLLADLEARRRAGSSEVSWMAEAEALVSLGRHADALAALGRARGAQEPRLASLRTGPVWDPLRADVRFQGLMRSLGAGHLPGAPLRPRGG
jgi:TolB-like protein/tetratricopeptide (TPR) repeat protein